MLAQELSLLDLYNKVSQQQAIYGDKIENLSDIFSGLKDFPKDVTNSNDSPSMWPDTGVNVYAILSEYNLAVSFCTVGILFNIGSGRYKYQFMLVQQDELNPIKNGKLYYRYSKATSNTWSKWMRPIYPFEFGHLFNGDERIKDDFGKDITDTEDEYPESNPHNFNKEELDGSESLGMVAAHSYDAEKLKTPRKIAIDGIVEGNVDFDGSENVTIDVQSNKVVPLNIRLGASRFLEDTYRLLCTLPAPSAANHDYVTITGHIGGWGSDEGKANINICASNSRATSITGMALGQIGDIDIVIYRTPTHEMCIYLKGLIGASIDDINLSVYGSAQINVVNQIEELDNTYNQIWSLKDDGLILDNANIVKLKQLLNS